MYHAIEEVAVDPSRICVTPHRFEEQMLHLKRQGLRGVSVVELLRASPAERSDGLVGLTFDDGYENFVLHALPVLEDLGFSATVFALGALLGTENEWDAAPRMRLLDKDGLREIAARGIEIGSHGLSHVRLAGVSEARLRREVVESRRVLERVIAGPIQGFCYPYGSLDRAATKTVRDAGYSYACSCRDRIESTVYDLPRPPVWEMDGPLFLTAKRRLYPVFSEVYSRVSGRYAAGYSEGL